MNSGQFAVTLITILTLSTTSSSQRLIRLHPQTSFLKNDIDIHTFCESWKFSVETNDAGIWSVVPDRCVGFVKDYMNGDRYRSDSELIADYALEYAKNVEIASDGKDVWIFDIDETLLSNLPYYVLHGYGSEVFDEKSFDEWVDLAEAPALPASFRLYTELQQLGFKIFLLTGRSEFQRKSTDKNLEYAGFTNYEKLILRGDSDLGKSATLYKSEKRQELKDEGYRIHGSSGDSDLGKSATLYKSEKRQELKDEGYRIHGSSGDQWSDLLGFATGKRSFKLPNPLYYIP